MFDGLKRLLLLTVLLALLIPGPALAAEPEAGQRPIVAVSVLPQRYFVEQIAGDLVDVHVIVPPSVSPETFDPGISAMKAAERASLYIKIGHPAFTFEGPWLEGLQKSNPSLRVIDNSEGFPASEDDPHVWVSPEPVRTLAKNIREALIELLPHAKTKVTENTDRFLEKLERLDNEIRGLLSKRKTRQFLVYHPAWGYFASHYGLEQIAIEHEGKEQGVGELMRTIERVRSLGLKQVFVQPGFSRQSAELVAREIGGEVVEVNHLALEWDRTLLEFARLLSE